MTATTLIATPDDIPAEFLEQMLRMQARFDANRPACPSRWCEGNCDTDYHFGDAVLHQSKLAQVPVDPDRVGTSAHLLVSAQRHDGLDTQTTSHVEIDFRSAGSLLEDRAHLTAAQARHFAAEILRHADMIDPEPEVPATDVRVRDWLPVGDEWFQIYGITVDEPTDSVQIYTTVDWDTLPELGGDEEPHVFDINDTVRIRRTAQAEVTR